MFKIRFVAIIDADYRLFLIGYNLDSLRQNLIIIDMVSGGGLPWIYRLK